MSEQKKSPGRPPGSKSKTKVNAEEQLRMEEQQRKSDKVRDEITAIVLLACGIFMIIALQTSAAGKLGSGISYVLKGCFGSIAYAIPYLMIVYAILIFLKKTAGAGKRSIICMLVIFVLTAILNSARFLEDAVWSNGFIVDVFNSGARLQSGGVIGMLPGFGLMKAIGTAGLYLFSCAAIVVCVLLIINTPISQFLDNWRIKRTAKRKAMELVPESAGTEPEATGIIPKEPKVPVASAAISVPAAGVDSVAGRSSIPVHLGQEDGGQPSGEQIQEPIRRTAKTVSSQMKILDYMKDESMFGRKEAVTGKAGLEEARVPVPGKGLEGGPVPGPTAGAATAAVVGTAMALEKTVTDKDLKKTEQKKTAEAPVELKIESPQGKTEKPWEFPPIDLLKKAPGVKDANESVILRAKAEKLEETLHNFGVNAKVLQVTRGPAVTRYEIQPSVGVKVSSITRLADDIALNLEAKSIRIEAPIPGKAAIGIEVENDRVNMVAAREIIENRDFRNAKSKITFAVGKDISGNCIVSDLKGMPHLLIAGSTGSGKSVCINTLIVSILYRAKPDEVKFVLIDPKVVELGTYNGIPHLLIPVVTEPSKAAAALNWAVLEMTDRYKKFAEEEVRDLESFNEKMRLEAEEERVMPQIVIIIDELADLMMAAPAQVEESICRLAQMARAAGMHLIVATQRPSVDVITGVIKANIPSRIAFAVSSQFDSRTIIDMSGAEKLVGKGDMLFNPLGMAKPIRVQGAFISDSEVHNVIDFLKKQSPDSDYASEILQKIEKTYETKDDEDGDELLQEAIETVVHSEQASVSMLQRRFRIGYNRAARLIDMMEARGIVSPPDGSRPRKVMMTAEQYEMLGRDPEETGGDYDDGVPEEI